MAERLADYAEAVRVELLPGSVSERDPHAAASYPPYLAHRAVYVGEHPNELDPLTGELRFQLFRAAHA